MYEVVTSELGERFSMFADLMEVLPKVAVDYRLEEPSNTIGHQLACVVSGRVSYGNGIAAGEWDGWTWAVSAEEASDKDKLEQTLASSATSVMEILDMVPGSEERHRLLLHLLEHETMHQGQLIRYVFGWGLEFPESWKTRWGL